MHARRLTAVRSP